MSKNDNIVITGIGMKTGVGNNAVQTGAAVRAGLNHFSDWPHFGGSFGPEGAGLSVSATSPDLGNAPWYDKVIPLVQQPFHEALWQAKYFEIDGIADGRYRSALYLSTPYADRPGTTPAAHVVFTAEARQHCIAPIQARATELFPAEHAGALIALARAFQDLQQNTIDGAMVGGIDSLLHVGLLGPLLAQSRLKLDAKSGGLIPGEGSAFLVLERATDAIKRGATPLARVVSVAHDNEPVPLGDKHPSKGEGLTRAMRQALGGVGDAQQIHRIIVDLNGERARFVEWAIVDTRCSHQLPRGWQLWHPADCLGDTGAAYGAIALGLAVHAFQRGYGGAGGILVCASSQLGERAAACLFPASAIGVDFA